MQDVIRAGWSRDRPVADWHPGDVDWRWATATGARAELWFLPDTGEIVGWGWVTHRARLDVYFAPDHRSSTTLSKALEWSETGRGPGSADPPSVWLLESDDLGRDVAGGRGYAATDVRLSYMHRLLSTRAGTPPSGTPHSSLHPGFTFGMVGKPDDVDARVDLYRAVFGTSPLTATAYRSLLRGGLHRSELDVVIRSPDCRDVAGCLGILDRATGVLRIEGTCAHPDFVGRGLARAVCARMLDRAAGLGATDAALFVNHDNPAAARLYAGLGFSHLDSARLYRRPG